MHTLQFLLLAYGLRPQVFLRRSHVMLLELCLCVVILKKKIFNASPTSHLQHFTNIFCVTPLDLHTRHLSYVSDGKGRCLLPHTSSLAKCDSTLGRPPNGLSTLHSGPAYANIFLTRVYRKSLCKMFLPHTMNEECSY